MGATASSVGDRAAPGVQESSILYFETMEEDNFNTALRKSLLSMWRRRLSRKNRMSHLSVWRRLSDGTTELIPLRHQYIPNAKETPELASAAKQEHVKVFSLLTPKPLQASS